MLKPKPRSHPFRFFSWLGLNACSWGIADEEAVEQSLELILLGTVRASRGWIQIEDGPVRILGRVHDADTLSAVEGAIAAAISRYERRILVRSVRVAPSSGGSSEGGITIDFELPGSQRRRSLTLPLPWHERGASGMQSCSAS